MAKTVFGLCSVNNLAHPSRLAIRHALGGDLPLVSQVYWHCCRIGASFTTLQSFDATKLWMCLWPEQTMIQKAMRSTLMPVSVHLTGSLLVSLSYSVLVWNWLKEHMGLIRDEHSPMFPLIDSYWMRPYGTYRQIPYAAQLLFLWPLRSTPVIAVQWQLGSPI